MVFTPNQVIILPELAAHVGLASPEFKVDRIIKGGMGECIRIVQNERSFALKVIQRELVEDSEAWSRYLREVRLWTTLGDRTLQRRIDDDGTTFRKLLLEARQELAREYLNRPDIDVAEVAYLLGYEDSNSFYRAFRTWEGTTPSQLRAELKRPVN